MPNPQNDNDSEITEASINSSENMQEYDESSKSSYGSDLAGATFFGIGLFVIVSSIVIIALYLLTDWDISHIYGTPKEDLSYQITRIVDDDTTTEVNIDYRLTDEYQIVKATTKNSISFGFSDVFESQFSWVYPLESSNQDGSLKRVNATIEGFAVETTAEKDYYGRYASSVFGDFLVSEGFSEDYFNWDGNTFFSYRKGDIVCRIMNGLGSPSNRRTRLSCGQLSAIAPKPKNSYAYLEVLGKVKEVFPNYSSPEATIISWNVDAKTDASGSKQLGGHKIESSSVRGDEVDLYLKFLGFEPNALNIGDGPQANIIGVEKGPVACIIYKQNVYSDDPEIEKPFTILKVDTTVSCGSKWWYFY